jgi:MFS family permease
MTNGAEPARPIGTTSAQKTSRVFYGWWVVVASGIGLAFCFGPIIVATFGIFLKPLSHEFGWSRAQISLAFSLAMVAHTVAVPFIGRLADYIGARKVILAGGLLLGVGVFSLSAVSAHLWEFCAIYVIIGTVAGGTAPVPYSKVIARWFDRMRGLALGLAMATLSVSFAIMPFVTQTLLVAIGWRKTYALMGLAVIVITIPVIGLLLKESPSPLGLMPDGDAVDFERSSAPIEQPWGMSFHETWHTGVFWIIVAAFFLMSASFHGVIVHLAPLLTDRGLSARNAALATSLVGVGSFLARIGIGYLLDIFFAASVAAWMFTASTIGLCILFAPTAGFLPYAAAFLFGVGEGAQLDVIPYMVSRYFGLTAFAEIYGYLFAVFTLGGVVGPMLMGKAFDALSSYGLVLAAFAVATLAASALMTRLGPYHALQPALQPA